MAIGQRYTHLRKRVNNGKGLVFAPGNVRVIDKQYITERVTIDDNGCWLWIGAKNSAGYAVALRKPKTTSLHIRMHRKSYELYKGEIPEGLVIDHLCRVRHCINPDHLEPVTIKENTLRSPLVNKKHDKFCLHGHEYTPETTFMRKTGIRNCRTCKNISGRKYHERKKLNATI